MNLLTLQSYRSLVFDCDGVILDSNQVKTQAFFNVTRSFGEEPANQLVTYHKEHGGISRYRKFEYFLSDIIRTRFDAETHQALLDTFSDEVRKGLRSCVVNPALEELRQLTPSASWAVVSGGDQSELRQIFQERNLSGLFDAGIFGSPETKETILGRELATGKLSRPVLFIGDSRYDHEAARTFDLDFLFVSGWSEFTGWRDYQSRCGFDAVTELGELLIPR